MKADVYAVMATQVPPDEEDEGLHEFSLYWYRFTDNPASVDPRLSARTRPAVWVRFKEISQLETLQGSYPEARLGPSSSYTEALIFSESWEEAKQLQKKVATLLSQNEDDTLKGLLAEDTLEDL